MRTYYQHDISFTNVEDNIYDIRDIARGLAYTRRWNGQIEEPMTVAEHSVLVYRMSGNYAPALLHDASEAYMSDVVYGLKQELPDYKAIENSMMCAIYKRFGLKLVDNQKVKTVDELCRPVELFLSESGYVPRGRIEAERLFLDTCREAGLL